MTLPTLESKDASGTSGLADRVDAHAGEALATAALLSAIGAAAQLSQPYGGYLSQGQVVVGAAGRQMADVTQEILRRGLDARPTIRIRQGMPFNVFLAADLTFAGPYAAQP